MTGRAISGDAVDIDREYVAGGIVGRHEMVPVAIFDEVARSRVADPAGIPLDFRAITAIADKQGLGSIVPVVIYLGPTHDPALVGMVSLDHHGPRERIAENVGERGVWSSHMASRAAVGVGIGIQCFAAAVSQTAGGDVGAVFQRAGRPAVYHILNGRSGLFVVVPVGQDVAHCRRDDTAAAGNADLKRSAVEAYIRSRCAEGIGGALAFQDTAALDAESRLVGYDCARRLVQEQRTTAGGALDVNGLHCAIIIVVDFQLPLAAEGERAARPGDKGRHGDSVVGYAYLRAVADCEAGNGERTAELHVLEGIGDGVGHQQRTGEVDGVHRGQPGVGAIVDGDRAERRAAGRSVNRQDAVVQPHVAQGRRRADQLERRAIGHADVHTGQVDWLDSGDPARGNLEVVGFDKAPTAFAGIDDPEAHGVAHVSIRSYCPVRHVPLIVAVRAVNQFPVAGRYLAFQRDRGDVILNHVGVAGVEHIVAAAGKEADLLAAALVADNEPRRFEDSLVVVRVAVGVRKVPRAYVVGAVLGAVLSAVGVAVCGEGVVVVAGRAGGDDGPSVQVALEIPDKRTEGDGAVGGDPDRSAVHVQVGTRSARRRGAAEGDSAVRDGEYGLVGGGRAEIEQFEPARTVLGQ